MEYVGVDWSYGRAAFCCRRPGGAISEEGEVPADADGLAALVSRIGDEVTACVEMMSGAHWVCEQLEAAGWTVQAADARKAKTLAPLTAKTDRIDARVLAELARRELVPAVWLPSIEDRAIREQLRRRMHLVRLRTSAKNRVFGVLSQWGVRVKFERLRREDGIELLERRGVPEVWRDSVVEAIAVVDWLDSRISPLDRELAPLAREDERARLLATIPGIGPLLGLTFAVEIGDVARFATPRKLVGYSGLVPRVHQSGQQSRTKSLAKAGPRVLRWAAVEAAQGAWREDNPWHRLYRDVKVRSAGKGNPAKAAVARKVLIAAWHVLSRSEPFRAPDPRRESSVPESSLPSMAA